MTDAPTGSDASDDGEDDVLRGNVRWGIAAVFSLAGVLGALAGSTLGKAIDGERLILLFAVMMIVIGGAMLRPRRGARLAAISTGAFALAATGLLDGRRATTHWHYTRALTARYPRVQVDENVLFVDDGDVITAAGVSAGIDMALHLVARLDSVQLARDVKRYIQYEPAPPV